MSDVIKRTTPEQREVAKSVDIIGFINNNSNESNNDYYFDDEESSAILNNVPGNSEIEKMNHLNGMEQVAKNYSAEEWTRLLYYAPSTMMLSELTRRMKGYEEYRDAQKNADSIMNKLKL